MNEYWVLEKEVINKNVINEFLLGLRLKNRSEMTIIGYKQCLSVFFSTIPKQVQDLTREDILLWKKNYSFKNKASSVISRLGILSVFLKFCEEEGYILKNIYRSTWKPKLPKPIPKYLERSEVSKIQISIENGRLRDEALFEFFVSSGCRVGEVHRLNFGDIDLPNRTVKVLGKGSKYRYTFFSEYCAVLLEKYTVNHFKDTPLFLSLRKKERLGIRSIEWIISEMGKKSQLNKVISPHKLRHTFATLLLAKGVDLKTIQDCLGHKQAKTTRIYASLPEDRIVELYNKYME